MYDKYKNLDEYSYNSYSKYVYDKVINKAQYIPTVEERAQEIFNELNDNIELFTKFNQILRQHKIIQLKNSI